MTTNSCQSITGPFGSLLRAVVGTVDEHGLKRRHLQRHERDVEKFFQHLAGQSFRSEAAEALRQRLLKYQGKLFTFLQYDGVPWNNNNAEFAIKQFAYYREETVGMMKEDGLRDYLVLLSVCQTCRYKGVSFLRFLLSRQKDVDAFGEGKHLRRRAEDIELYPQGFILAHFRNREKARLEKECRQAKQRAGNRTSERFKRMGMRPLTGFNRDQRASSLMPRPRQKLKCPCFTGLWHIVSMSK